MASKFLTNIELNAGLVDVNGNTGTSGQILSSTGSGVDWVSLSEISGVDGTGTANYVAKWSDADTITDSVIYDNGTNVGIGTTSPAARLEVKSAAPNTFFADFISSTGSGFAKIYENSNSHPLLYMADATGTTTVVLNSSGVSYLISGNIIIGGTADNGNLLQVQGTSYFDGNVGIGTTSPSQKLEVNGNAIIGGGTLDNPQSWGKILQVQNTGSNGAGISVKDSNNEWNLATYNGVFNISDGIEERIIINTNGNVGIGTTSPDAPLTVTNNAVSSYIINVNMADDVDGGGFYEATGGMELYLKDTSGTGQVKLTSSGSSYLNGGNVGIGTTSPVVALDLGPVTGKAFHLYSNSGDFYGMNMLQYDSQGFSTNIFSGNGGYIKFRTASGTSTQTTRMTINPTGNVGVGTTSPSYKLDVSGTGRFTENLFIEGVNTPTITITDTTNNLEGKIRVANNYMYIDADNSDTVGSTRILLRTDGVEALRLDENQNATFGGTIAVQGTGNSSFAGNVGIGMTSPSYKLDVSGTGNFQSNLQISNADQSTTRLLINNTSSSGNRTFALVGGIHNASQEGFSIYDTVAADTRLVILNDGNVGIGTTNPLYKLDVNGRGRFTGATLFQSQLTVAGGSGDSVLEVGNSGIGGNHRINIIPAGSGQDAGYYISGTPRVYTNTGNTSITRINAPSTGIIQFETNLTERVRINNGGNVGIGTTSPTAKLTIGGLGIGNTGGLKIEESSSTADGAHFSYNDDSRYVVFGGITNNVLNDAIAITRDATRTITIDSLERVGIGTTSPSYKLDVSGTGRFTSDLTATDYTGNVNGLTSAQYSKFAFKTTGTGASDSGKYTKIARITLTGQYQNTATSLHYVSNGNGSTPISAGKLDIRVKQQAAFGNDPLVDVTNYHNYTSYAKFGYVIVQNTPTTIVDVYVQNTTTYNDITGYITTDDYINTTKITWYTNQSYVTIPGSYVVGNNRLLISANPSGNVSIGNTNDTYKLDVSGTGRFTSDLTVQGTGDSSFAGNVGIGTTSPSEKLEVDGTIKATDYKGYLPAFQHGGFQHTASTSSTTVYWIPTNNNSEVISSQSYNNWVAPYDGRVKKIVMRWASNGTPTATSVIFRKAINGTTDATLYSATVTSPATTDMIVGRDFLSTDISFQAGDRVQLGFTTDGGTRLLQGFAYTIVLEYNKD
jgi:hypothetical protein